MPHTAGIQASYGTEKSFYLCSGRTNAAQSVLSRFVACVAGTLVAADHVDTLAIAAQLVTQLTFIDICETTNQWSNTRYTHVLYQRSV